MGCGDDPLEIGDRGQLVGRGGVKDVEELRGLRQGELATAGNGARQDATGGVGPCECRHPQVRGERGAGGPGHRAEELALRQRTLPEVRVAVVVLTALRRPEGSEPGRHVLLLVPARAPDTQKTGARHYSSWPVSPLAPRSRGDHTKAGVSRRGQLQLQPYHSPYAVARHRRAAQGPGKSVIPCNPGGVEPFLRLRFTA